MKFIHFFQIGLGLLLVMPLFSFADDNNDRQNRFFKGTYAIEVSQHCIADPPGAPNLELASTGVFTLDGRGNFVWLADDVFITSVPGGNSMGQNDVFCTGAYFVERFKNSFVIKIPEQLCVGKSTFGSPGAAPENPGPEDFFNFDLLVRDVSMIFQQGGRKAGIFSDIPPVDVPVDMETLNFPDDDFSVNRRCRRIGSFNRVGRFKVLNPPVPAGSGEPPP